MLEMTKHRPTTVLIVDDQMIISLQLTYIIKDSLPTVSILTAVDGEEGLGKAITHHPDLIITDLAMPRMDGYEMVKRIRQEEIVRAIPIIGISASDPAEIKATGFLKLCDAFLHKPFMQHEVVEKVTSLLSRTVLTV